MGFSVITTVLLPADSHDLTDLATVKSELSIGTGDTTNDAWLARAITQVSKSIERYTGRVFAVEQLQDQFQIARGTHSSRIRSDFAQLELTRWPVIELTSVEQSLAPSCPGFMNSGDYRLDAEAGRLLRIGKGSMWEAIPVAVTYIAGYWIIPEDLVEICLRLVSGRFRAKGRDPSLIQRDTPGIGTERFWFGGVPGQNGPFPPDIQSVLDDYRVPTVA